MGEAKSVVIKLTNEQREAIKRTTGQDIAELKVEAMEGRESPLAFSRVELRKAPWGSGREAEARKAPFEGGAEAELRKAPFEVSETEARKAPFDAEDIASRKAPFGGGDKQ